MTINQELYTYKANIINVADGDTVDAIIDLGMDIYTQRCIRLYGIDAPDLCSDSVDEQVMAKRSRERLHWLILGQEVLIKTFIDNGKGNRILASIYVDGNVNINDLLVAEHLAHPYYGGDKKSFDELLKEGFYVL